MLCSVAEQPGFETAITPGYLGFISGFYIDFISNLNATEDFLRLSSEADENEHFH